MRKPWVKGAQSQISGKVIPLSDLAERILDKMGPPPAPRRIVSNRGYSVDRPTTAKTLLTDAQVVECRARHEFDGWELARLCEEYGVSERYMKQLLSYVTRSKLIPKRSVSNLIRS